MIRKVEVKVKDVISISVTAHWIEGKDEEDILRIVKKYNISNPIGRDLTDAELTVCDNDFMYDYRPIKLENCQEYSKSIFRPRSFFKGKVWFEKDDELCSIPIKERYKQLFKLGPKNLGIITTYVNQKDQND